MANKTSGNALNHKRTSALVRLGLALGIGYILASVAIDTGSYWPYLGSLIAFIVIIRQIKRIVKTYGRDQ